jgi:hypothetical protein
VSEHKSDLPDLLPERAKRRPLWLRILCVAGAIVLFVAGIVGWLVPVVTGIPFYVGGVILLAVASERVREWVNRLERGFPHRLRLKLRQWVEKLRGKKSGSPDSKPHDSARETREDKVRGGV